LAGGGTQGYGGPIWQTGRWAACRPKAGGLGGIRGPPTDPGRRKKFAASPMKGRGDARSERKTGREKNRKNPLRGPRRKFPGQRFDAPPPGPPASKKPETQTGRPFVLSGGTRGGHQREKRWNIFLHGRRTLRDPKRPLRKTNSNGERGPGALAKFPPRLPPVGISHARAPARHVRRGKDRTVTPSSLGPGDTLKRKEKKKQLDRETEESY